MLCMVYSIPGVRIPPSPFFFHMNIRKAKTEDIDQIIALGNNVDEFKVSKDVVTFWPKDVLERCVESNNPILVCEVDNQIIGFIIANYNESFKKAIIENTYVLTSERGKGYGKALLKELLVVLEDSGCQYVCTLIETQSICSIDFYTRNGFDRGIDCAWLDMALGENFKES